MDQVNLQKMNIREAINAIHHHGASDEIIFDAYKSLSPEHIGGLEALVAEGVTVEKPVDTAVAYKEAFEHTAESGA